MSRIRTIKPDFAFDEELAKLPHVARLFFILLWTQSDKSGRGEDSPGRLRALIFPYEPEIDAEAIMSSLYPKFVIRYAVGERRYFSIRNWEKHQRPNHREQDSTIPAPTSDDITRARPGTPGQTRGDGKGREGKGKEGKVREMSIVPSAQEGVLNPIISKSTELTAIQKVIRGFKEAKGIDADNKDWDRKFFARQTRPAKELLTAFNDDPLAAIAYVLAKSVEWEHLSDWGLEAVVKAAGREYNRIGGEHGRKDSEVVNARLDGPGRGGRATTSRALAGDALRAIEQTQVSRKEPGNVAGGLDTFGGDGEDFS